MTRAEKTLVAALLFGTAVVLTGCPKKVDTAGESAGLSEEQVGGPGATAPGASPRIEEMPMTSQPQAVTPGGRPGQAVAELNDIYFDFDQFTIRDDQKPALDSAARHLADNPSLKVKIEGHCDERGTNDYNLALGERRAQAVKRYLVAAGVDAGRLSTISFGEEQPACNDKSEDCFAQNRRARFARR
jgi:peptidoglycan-associated lipoprotein